MGEAGLGALQGRPPPWPLGTAVLKARSGPRAGFLVPLLPPLHREGAGLPGAKLVLRFGACAPPLKRGWGVAPLPILFSRMWKDNHLSEMIRGPLLAQGLDSVIPLCFIQGVPGCLSCTAGSEGLLGLARGSQGVVIEGLQVWRAIQPEPLTRNLLAEVPPQPAVDQAVQEALEGGGQSLGRAEKSAMIPLRASLLTTQGGGSSPHPLTVATKRGKREESCRPVKDSTTRRQAAGKKAGWSLPAAGPCPAPPRFAQWVGLFFCAGSGQAGLRRPAGKRAQGPHLASSRARGPAGSCG